MLWVRRAANLLQRFLRWRQAEEELDEEVRAYFEISVAREMERGLSPEEARRIVRMRCDGPE
ncbi:MAG: permease prefix domain 1-containing protein, partial [Bryobacteraceae bacterium]